MPEIEVKLRKQLTICRNSIKTGYTSTKNGDKKWLNQFCQEFAQFSSIFHTFLQNNLPHDLFSHNEHIECIFLCLKQIVCCIKHMERTLTAEQTGGIAASDARQHFLDRINYCLEKIRIALKKLENISRGKDRSLMLRPIENWSFMELLDVALDDLMPYCSYEITFINNIAEENAEAIFASKNIRSFIDVMLGQALALANVALLQDKGALSALCQKVLRECIAFEEECSSIAQQAKVPGSNRRLKASALEKALLQLERYINESLLRLVYQCFLDFEKISIDKLRVLVRLYEGQDNAGLDELIADFDVNMDRTAQIGNFAIAFAPNVKVRTIIRSVLASFESLDACLIPALYAKSPSANIYSELLEQHFNEELSVFKNSIQELIKSRDFTSCYYEMLLDGIKQAEKQYDKTRLQELIKMGKYLLGHFEIKVNNTELHAKTERLELYEKFSLILHECQAILMCANQVDKQRILKRFKILRSILYKFLQSLSEINSPTAASTITTTKTETPKDDGEQNVNCANSQGVSSFNMLASLGITPSKRSILYCHEEDVLPEMIHRRFVSDSMRGNTSKFPIVTLHKSNQLQQSITFKTEKIENEIQASDDIATKQQQQTKVLTSMRFQATMANNEQPRRCYNHAAVRRKESLRTAMFKRQKTTESEKIYSFYKNNSMSLQITEILDQLATMSF